jgi:hypothetical protein
MILPLTADSYSVESLPQGWVTAEVNFRHADGKVSSRYEILDVRLGPIEQADRYCHEPLVMIAFKCFGLFILVLPLYFLLYTAYQIVRTPIVVVANLSPTALIKQIWAIARTPLYFLKMEYAAVYGIFRPLEGRALLSSAESELHGGKGLHDDCNYQKAPFGPCCKKSLLDLEPKQRAFVALCMQKIGKANDPHIVSVRAVQPAPVPLTA